MKQTQFWS